MMPLNKKIQISSWKEYQYAVKRGFEPLLDLRFQIDIGLRKAIQQEMFGMPKGSKNRIQRGNQKFYYWIWERKPHICEETGLPLYNYSAQYISHILTRGAHPEMAHDPRNTNILSVQAHDLWEFGNRYGMLIYGKNIEVENLLKQEYGIR